LTKLELPAADERNLQVVHQRRSVILTHAKVQERGFVGSEWVSIKAEEALHNRVNKGLVK
jgi:antirestriction protein ArdC